MNPEIVVKQDNLGGYYSMILRDLSSKPNDVAEAGVKKSAAPKIPAVDGCLFCAGNEDGNTTTYQYPEASSSPWLTRGIENKWFFGDPHNVLILTPEHKGLYDLSKRDWITGFKGLKYFDKGKSNLIFANHGPLAGGSQPHSHAQIVGLDILPVNSFEEKATSADECVLCAKLPEGLIVWQNRDWTIYSPEVPQLGGELRLVNRIHKNGWQEDMADGLVELIRLTGLGYDWEDFSLIFHITNVEHSHIHIIPRRNPVSVLKLGWDIYTVKDPFVYAAKLRKMMQ